MSRHQVVTITRGGGAAPTAPTTREQFVEVAWRNGVLAGVVNWLLHQGDTIGPRLTEDQAIGTRRCWSS